MSRSCLVNAVIVILVVLLVLVMDAVKLYLTLVCKNVKHQPLLNYVQSFESQYNTKRQE